MPQRLFTADDVAGTLDIPLSTLEVWCALFGNCLSASASQMDLCRPGCGDPVFTENDVAVLAGAKKLLSRQVTSSPRNGTRVG